MASKQQQARINRWVARWKSRLLLDNWGITIEYKTENQIGKRTDGEQTSTAAEVIVDHRYREARISIYPVLFTRPLNYQRSTIVHELLHIATDPVKSALDKAVRNGAISGTRADDIVEGITEYITKVTFKAYARTNKSLDNYHV